MPAELLRFILVLHTEIMRTIKKGLNIVNNEVEGVLAFYYSAFASSSLLSTFTSFLYLRL